MADPFLPAGNRVLHTGELAWNPLHGTPMRHDAAMSNEPTPVPTGEHHACGHSDHPESGVPGTSLHWCDTQSEIHRIVVGDLDNNVFVLRCRATGEAVLIDAANEHDKLLELCRTLDVRTVLETHGHWDHIGAVPAVREAGYQVGVTTEDAHMLDAYDYLLEDESVIEVGHLRLHTIKTPGHTPGSISFRLEGSPIVFVGDTLFPGGPGASNFEGGDFDTIIQTIDRKLFAALPPETIVLPGHGTDTLIGNESPHLDEWAARGW